MKPYYEHAGITIYHGDCREILPRLDLASVDLAFVDPPYGMRLDASFANSKPNPKKGIAASRGYEQVVGDDDDFDPEPVFAALSRIGEQFWWGADYYRARLPGGGSWLVWDKRVGLEQVQYSSAEFELCWSRRVRHRKILRHRWFGLCGTETQDIARRVHPNQKPRELVDECVRLSKTTGTILDPFFGSGTTLYVAKNAGRKAIGVEIVESYCEIAAKRLSQEVLDFTRTA